MVATRFAGELTIAGVFVRLVCPGLADLVVGCASEVHESWLSEWLSALLVGQLLQGFADLVIGGAGEFHQRWTARAVPAMPVGLVDGLADLA
jgi:hypothetical protein